MSRTLQSPVISVDQSNAKAILIDCGYYEDREYQRMLQRRQHRQPNRRLGSSCLLRMNRAGSRIKHVSRTPSKPPVYEVEILFSQGDAAREKANVEALVKKGIKVLIICPQGGGEVVLEVKNWSAHTIPPWGEKFSSR